MSADDLVLTEIERRLVLALRAMGPLRTRHRAELFLTPVPGEVGGAGQRSIAWVQVPGRVVVDAAGKEVEVVPPGIASAEDVNPAVAITDAVREMVRKCKGAEVGK